ncbi:UNKNOWN [Stylonychia lemnae]|uniref:Uncharacterized protein n=1 Tax=Stylonychia lemnae TaxID=5949 RepID=A0A078B5B3_STYLE|nr:UNKNOWN [Stylonychia lemnae]|eukprot:CDW89376.1 UNKNOWN [Stylonychia lemnae]
MDQELQQNYSARIQLNANTLIEQLKSGTLSKDQLLSQLQSQTVSSRQMPPELLENGGVFSNSLATGQSVTTASFPAVEFQLMNQPLHAHRISNINSNINVNDQSSLNFMNEETSQEIIQMQPCQYSHRNSIDIHNIGNTNNSSTSHLEDVTLREISNFRGDENTSTLMEVRNSREKKLYQMPLQFSDKFFDEDPGLIKIVDNQGSHSQYQNTCVSGDEDCYNDQTDRSGISRQSIEYIRSNLQLFDRKRSTNQPSYSNNNEQFLSHQNTESKLNFNNYNDEPQDYMDKEEIMRRANELTRAIDNQFSYLLTQRDDQDEISQNNLLSNQHNQHINHQANPSNVERVHQFASIFNSPVASQNTRNNLLSSQVEPIVNVNQVLREQLPFSNYSSNTNSKPNLHQYPMIDEYQIQQQYTQRPYHRSNEFQNQDITQYSQLNETQTVFYDQSTDGQGISTILGARNGNNKQGYGFQGSQTYRSNENKFYNNNQNMHQLYKDFQAIDSLGSYEVINDTKGFNDRNNKWINQQAYKKTQIQQQQQDQQMKECTFKPQTNSKSSKILNNRRNGSGSKRGERLYESKFKKVQETQQRYAQEQEDKIQQQCTFKPQLNEKDVYGVGSRYMQITEDLVQNRIHVNDFYNAGLQHYNQEQSELRECTFAPQINGLKKHMQTAQLYTSINAFERLSKPLSQLMPQIDGTQNDEEFQNQQPNDFLSNYPNNTIQEEESEIEKIQSQLNSFGQQLQNFQTFNTQSNSKDGNSQQLQVNHYNNVGGMSQNCANLSSIQSQLTNTSQSKINNAQIQPILGLLERQNKFLLDKEEHIKKIKEDLSHTHKPQILDITNTQYQDHVQGLTFGERNQLLLEKKQNHQLQQNTIELQNCTFQPQITKKGQQQHSKNIEEISYGDFIKKQQKLDRIAAELDMNLKQVATFKPDLVTAKTLEFQQVNSKLQIQSGGLDDFIKACQIQQDQRLKEAEQFKKMKEEQELQECTHRPQTIELPDYIKRIAEESKKIKAERALIQSQLPQQKPEFRVC